MIYLGNGVDGNNGDGAEVHGVQARLLFNQAQRKARRGIENTFGYIKQQFPCLAYKWRHARGLQPLVACTCVGIAARKLKWAKRRVMHYSPY